MPAKKNKSPDQIDTILKKIDQEFEGRLSYVFSAVKIPEVKAEPVPEVVVPPVEVPLPAAAVEAVQAQAAATEKTGELKEFSRVQNRISGDKGTVIQITGDVAQVVYDRGVVKFESVADLQLI
ncbi:hypothetical protein [Huginn virus]|nr:hypothetical protein [Huginn virus]